ncbi:MAG: pirin family protein, partial [Gammaproteobacteria bacterium]
GGLVRVIAGKLGETAGLIAGLTTEPVYFDVHLPAGALFSHALTGGHNAFVYPYEGTVRIGSTAVPPQSAGVLSAEGDVVVTAGADGARFLLLAGKPLKEPVVQYGPFVMNTVEEIQQAVNDYQSGRLTLT